MNPQPKQKRIIDKDYIEWLKQQQCCISGDITTERIEVVPAHQTLGYGCMAGKGHDPWALPLRADLHDLEHHGHKSFWRGRNIPQMILDHNYKYYKKTGKRALPQEVTEILIEKSKNYGGFW